MPRTADPPSTPASLDLSVLIPTFRRNDTLPGAVQSVLRPSALSLEVLIADDSPEGGARTVIADIPDPRVYYTHRDQPTGGVPARVRNDLSTSARGRFLYFLDDDDTAHVECLARIVAEMSRSGAGVGIGVVCPHGPDNQPVVQAEIRHYQKARQTLLRCRSRLELAARLMFRDSIICCSACVVSREAFYRIGGFDTDIPLYEDVEFYLQAAREFGFVFVDQPLLDRRTGEPSLIQNETTDDRTVTSFKMIYERYRHRHGWAEWLALRGWAVWLR